MPPPAAHAHAMCTLAKLTTSKIILAMAMVYLLLWAAFVWHDADHAVPLLPPFELGPIALAIGVVLRALAFLQRFDNLLLYLSHLI